MHRFELREKLASDRPRDSLRSYFASNVDYAHRHKAMIDRFGRYPYRNDQLGRETTEEEREFLARPETRILEEGVAHHYYFLSSLREGSAAPVLEPRTRRQLRLVASAWVDQVLDLGTTQVPARRVVFTAGEEERIVWFDRQGRVLRLEIPSRSFAAVRTDLVG